MKIFRTFEEIIDYAIDKEMNEIEFYSDLADRMDRKNVRRLFHNIALEKTARMLRLEKMKDLKLDFDTDDIQDMKIAGYLEEVDVTNSDLSYQDALILAMKKEKVKFKFYIDMAEKAINEECKQTFLALANEEARQKLKFEIEYDEYVLMEN
ncbi:rubrerythrin [Marinifilum sp. N1E240]|uniref:ferritin family protein n=1 Tax=Marinifilum sp. N1E240 TaxID=2608082 RepID=UPI00128D5AC0|nr:ferritin family protein [Marinifilum sp. N1E240]MPQ48839.1 rubrerythrin [Marinifilum sp. N1E240]|eukprot:TRINITY_DN9390_c0_g1_i1.p1 TRINITY_DN9390_c0_g1~~TRINITY_DN9390_c0_g1_i1.p1  ORF type:complete len:152 (+),score=30.41 TRINITY_DN9390_c0_g1_i1:272-727(+)